MPSVSEQQILDALRIVQDPDLRRDIVSLGFVKDVRISGAEVSFKVELTTPACPVKDLLKEQARAAVAALPGVEAVQVEMTARVREDERSGPLIPGVKNVIAVASGKGGVGKSTVSVNLAVALAQSGAKVGLLDADIYGPSIPMMMGATEDPVFDGKMLHPVQTHGVGIMSIGFFMEEGKAIVWRGPMIGKALNQFLGEVEWGALDYLVVDLPPGTGDASMSLAQLIPLTGVVVVMTPQDVAREIANKAVLMFRMLEHSTGRRIPILGVVENMSGFVCPSCGVETPLFRKGGGEAAAVQLGVAFLGAVPVDPAITISGDAGEPAILLAPESKQAEAFRRIAGQVAARVSTLNVEAEAAQQASVPG
jgi:ATP-binding protein involved in chromosome partitioning